MVDGMEPESADSVAPQDTYAIDVDIDSPEPWESFETTFCLWSIGIGAAGLVVLSTLVNIFLLS